MLWYLRSTESTVIRLGETFHRDLSWFTRFLALFNESPSFKMIGDRDDIHVWVDASLTGIGRCGAPGHMQRKYRIVYGKDGQ